MKAVALLLLLAVVSLSTIGEDHQKPVWLSTLDEPEPVNVSVIPRPVVAGNVSTLVDIRTIPVFVNPDLVEYTMARLRGEEPDWLRW